MLLRVNDNDISLENDLCHLSFQQQELILSPYAGYNILDITSVLSNMFL